MPSALQDLLLLVYKRVQSVKLLLLRVRQGFAKVASGKMLQDNSSAANVSQIKFGYSQARILLNKTKEKGVLLTIVKKSVCTVNFSMIISPNSQDKFRFQS